MVTGVPLPGQRSQQRSFAADTLPRCKLAELLSCWLKLSVLSKAARAWMYLSVTLQSQRVRRSPALPSPQLVNFRRRPNPSGVHSASELDWDWSMSVVFINVSSARLRDWPAAKR